MFANESNNDKEVQKYMVHRSLHYVQRLKGMNYLVRCYGWGTQSNKLKPTAHISQHFIGHYC